MWGEGLGAVPTFLLDTGLSTAATMQYFLKLPPLFEATATAIALAAVYIPLRSQPTLQPRPPQPPPISGEMATKRKFCPLGCGLVAAKTWSTRSKSTLSSDKVRTGERFSGPAW